MSDLRKLAHLKEQLGDERFAALINSGNTGKVKSFCDQLCDQLFEDSIPTSMTIAGRTYEILDFLREEDRESVSGSTMVERANEMQAHLGQDDGQHLLNHQEEIPEALRGKVAFVFIDWRLPARPAHVTYIHWCGNRWVMDIQYGHWLTCVFSGNGRLLRRK